jgi:hypothetical protein
MGKKWSLEEDALMKNNYGTMPFDELKKLFKRTESAIYNRAKTLNIFKRDELTHKEYCDFIKNNSEIIVIDGIYTGLRCFLTFKCLKHDFIWTSMARCVLKTLRCPRCHKNKKRTHEDYVAEVAKINPHVKILSEFKAIKKQIRYRCIIHNLEFTVCAGSLLEGHGCLLCNKSRGENRVCKFLESHEIKYIPQFKFKNCRNKNSLPFDFAIFDNHELRFLLEYDGETHYFPYDKNEKGEIKLQQVKRNDAIKTKFCEDNNIKLLRIPYWDFDNIEIILEKELSPFSEGGENIDK